MALAGLWETWKSRTNNETVRSFTIVTTAPQLAVGAKENEIKGLSGISCGGWA